MGERKPQVLVVGGGLAGHVAALSAAQAGAEVLLLEKRTQFGGSSMRAGGGLAFAGTELQRRSGVAYTAEELADDLMTAGGGKSDPALVAAYVREQAAVYRWLCALGAVFHLTGEPVRRLHTMPSGTLVRLLHARALDEPNLTYRATMPVASLRIVDGHVAGARLLDGTEVRADAVVLTTGGFSRNAGLVARLAPQCANAVPMGGLGNDGDGLLMAVEHGAALAGMEDVEASFGASAAIDLPPRLLYAHLDGAVIVNVLGERFVDERSDIKALGSAVAQQPRGLAYQVFDQAVMDRSRETPKPRDFVAAHRDGLLVEAGTLADLAAAIGVPVPVLAESARDQVRPPFYAFACRAGLTSTYGGLRVDASMRVLDATGGALTGLYAAGELVGGFHGAGYVIGTALGKAAVFGHVAGREAAMHPSAREDGLAEANQVPGDLPDGTDLPSSAQGRHTEQGQVISSVG